MKGLWRLSGVRWRVPRESEERAGLERIIAAARGVVAATCLLSVEFTQPAPFANTDVVRVFLYAYILYAVSVVVLLRYRPAAVLRRGAVVHALDVLWAAGLTSMSGATSSHFSPSLFVFALLAAAYRWGFIETVMTGVASAVVLAAEAVATAWGLLGIPLQVGDFIMGCVWLLLVAVILASLARWNERLRAELALVARIGQHARVQRGLRASVRAVLDELGRAFGAERTLLVAGESSAGRVFLWSTDGAKKPVDAGDGPAEIDPAQRNDYLFPVPVEAGTWGAVARTRAGRPLIRAVDSRGRRVAVSFPIPDQIAGGIPWRAVVSMTAALVEEWDLRLLLINPAVDATEDRQLRFLQTIARQVGPGLVNIYLVRRLAANVEEIERARVARELHDGVIQSLIGIEIEMDVARQNAEREPRKVAPALERLQRLLRDQIVDVRTLMQRLRPVQVDGRTLVGSLADIVARVGRTSDMEAAFVSEANTVDLPPRVCRELVRIVEEAMVNARKHSGAAQVTVTFGASDGSWRLVVDDNGRGFPFSGRLTQAELEDRGTGPAVIMERVRSIGGRLWIQSAPGKGSQLDIRIQGRENS